MGSVNLCCEVILIICILGECVAKVVLMSIVFCVKGIIEYLHIVSGKKRKENI